MKLITIQLIDRFLYGGAERVAMTYRDTLERSLKTKSLIYAIKAEQREPDENVRLFSNHFLIFYYLFKLLLNHRLVLFCHTVRTLELSCLLKLLFLGRVKIVYIRHFQYTTATKKILEILRIFIDRAILITPAEKEKAQQIFGMKLHYINNYIIENNLKKNDLYRPIKLWAKNRKIVAFAGAMKKGKNPEHLLELALILGNIDYCYLFIGDGPEKAIVNQYYEKYRKELEGSVFFCGFQEDVISILKKADYFFFSSWNNYEMMPMVLLEAMTANCICFAYNMEVNKFILPKEHLFEFQDYESIKKAIQQDAIKFLPNLFNSNYGSEKLMSLIRAIQ